MVVVVYSVEQPRRWPKQLCFYTATHLPKGEAEIGINILGLLYVRLDECVINITRLLGCYEVVTHADSNFF